MLHQGLEAKSVRAVFTEGSRLYPNSAIFGLAHVQIVIRNLSAIQKLDIIKVP
jgi:hypothetical protein